MLIHVGKMNISRQIYNWDEVYLVNLLYTCKLTTSNSKHRKSPPEGTFCAKTKN